MTFAEGDVVRVAGWRGTWRLKRLNLVRLECDVWGPLDGARQSMRSCETARLVAVRVSAPGQNGTDQGRDHR